MKSDAERGRWGRFLREQRLKRGLSQEQVRAEMLTDRAYAVGESSYAEWESGYKQPSREAQGHFTALWKAQPDPEPQRAPDAPTDDVAAAIREQTQVMRELVAELRARDERISPEGLTVFLRQLQSEGWLTVPETPSNTDVPQQPVEANGR